MGKPASLFTSTASQGGGQETTLMTAVTQLAHHGMIFVPAGYQVRRAPAFLQSKCPTDLIWLLMCNYFNISTVVKRRSPQGTA